MRFQGEQARALSMTLNPMTYLRMCLGPPEQWEVTCKWEVSNALPVHSLLWSSSPAVEGQTSGACPGFKAAVRTVICA